MIGREQGEGLDVVGSDDAEMPTVERGDLSHTKAFDDGYDRCVSATQAEIGIALGDSGGPPQIRQREVTQVQLSRLKGPDKKHLSTCSGPLV